MTTKGITLITGCSSGIGFELLQLMVEEGFRVVATALPSSIEQLSDQDIAQNPLVTICSLDIQDFEATSKLVLEVEETIGPIDILVNNAGISYRSVVEDMSIEDEQRQMTVNYLGPMHLIRETLPYMRKRRCGRIINISSVGGMMAMPTMASYSASKFALEGASESLWYELKPWGIHVSLVRPGFINSLAFTKVHSPAKKKNGVSDSEYESHYSNMTSFIEKFMTRTPCTSKDAARKILKIAKMENPPLRSAGTPDAQLFNFIRRILPRFLYHKILYRMLPKIKTWGPIKD